MQKVSMDKPLDFKLDSFVMVQTPCGAELALKVLKVAGLKVTLQTGLKFNIRKALKTLPHGVYKILYTIENTPKEICNEPKKC